MLQRELIKETVFSDELPCNEMLVTEFVAWLDRVVPTKFRETAHIEFDTYGHSIDVEIWYNRHETDAEYDKRVLLAAENKLRNEARERETLKSLLAKYPDMVPK